MEAVRSKECLPGATVTEMLARSRRALVHAGIETGAREAVWLLEKGLKTTQLKMLLDANRLLTQSECAEVDALVRRRATREPLQYILGTQEFCGLDFEVGPAVLIPRPETELLVEEVAQALISKAQATIVDVGTGSGCLAVALASILPGMRVYAVDCSADALAIAQKNIARHSVTATVTCLFGDLCMPLDSIGLVGRVEVMVSNPPYIAEAEWRELQPEVRDFEPRDALFGGAAGTEVHRRLIDQAWKYLVPGGWLFMEVGRGQSEAVCRLAARTGRYGGASVRRDAAGIERVIRLQSLEY